MGKCFTFPNKRKKLAWLRQGDPQASSGGSLEVNSPRFMNNTAMGDEIFDRLSIKFWCTGCRFMLPILTCIKFIAKLYLNDNMIICMINNFA